MRIASFQRFPVFDDVEKAADLILSDLRWADEHSVDLALFSECYLQGHTYTSALAEKRALSLDDPEFLHLIARFAPIRTTAIIGFFERRGDAVYNSAMVVERGCVAGAYAKVHPIEHGCFPGTDFPVWTRVGRTFGINICNDLNYPETAARLAGQGASLICCPINMMLRPMKAEIWREASLQNLQACARRTGCWVMSSDAVGENGDGWVSYGATVIVNPEGAVIGHAVESAEDVVLADLP